MMKEILAAAAGTFAFSVLFGVPGKYYPFCGIIGESGWFRDPMCIGQRIIL